MITSVSLNMLVSDHDTITSYCQDQGITVPAFPLLEEPVAGMVFLFLRMCQWHMGSIERQYFII